MTLMGAGFLAAALLIMLLAPSFLPRVSGYISFPFLQTKIFLGERLAGSAAGFRAKSSLFRENQILKERLTLLSVELREAGDLRRENEYLRGLGPSGRPRGLPAAVLSRPPRLTYDTFLLDSGRLSGVLEGAKVISGRVALGEVERVYRHSSLVKLYSSPDREVDVELSGLSAPTVARGRGGGGFEMELSKEAPVVAGDLVYLPGGQAMLGAVESIESRETDAFKKVFFKTPLNLFEIRFVEIKNNEE